MSEYVPYIALFSAWVFNVSLWLVIVWVIASWLVMFGIISPHSGLWRALSNAVEPIVRPFRWARIGMIDLSPLAAWFVLSWLSAFIMQFAVFPS